MSNQVLIERAHKRAAARICAEFRHFSWVQDETQIASKLRGDLILVTVRLGSGRYQHKVTAAGGEPYGVWV